MDMSFLVIGEKYTRPELAERWSYSSHHAIGKGVVTPQGEKVIILFVTRIKQEALTQYVDALSGDLLFWEGQEKHGTDDRVIDAAKVGDEVHLFYREIHHTPFEYKGQVLLLSHQRGTEAPSRFVFRLEHDQGAADDLERFRSEIDAVPEVTEREELRKARVGQGRFRKLLLERWGSQCAVTGVSMPVVLMASHIKPWRCAGNSERLDPNNGLLLLPQYDKLFDKGYISFDEGGGLMASPALPEDRFDLLGIRAEARLVRLVPEHQPFLSFHRDRVFIHRDEDA
jgi:putative restriction endonuclease